MKTTPQEIHPRHRLEFHELQQNRDPINSDVDNEGTESLHSNVSKDIIPIVGMEFETEKDAYEFYNSYALAVGFSVRKSYNHKLNGVVIDKAFVCSSLGKRDPDKKDDVYKSHRPETRFGCLAMMKINCRYTGKYGVEKFIVEHNHVLASPRKAHMFRSHRHISTTQALQVDMADSSGIAPRNTYEFMARQAGGREKLGFSKIDVKNYLRSKRSLEMVAGDTGGVLEFLQSMKEEDPGFFYAIQVDEDDLITNIFWANAKMIADFEDLGDVVCFDTTYRKYKDGRPIALFVGVNHHKQSTIFGAALLYDETTNTFIWLFDTFSRAMGGKLPQTILTDQDAAMAKALAFQWPETYHRLCIWHIYQNAAVHLKHVFKDFKDFSRDFSNCIYDYEHEEDFLDAWRKMLDKYELQQNDWLKRMFNIKEKWALVYERDTFCADMTTTQRSESMNSLIKKYVSYKHDMRRFFDHFQRLLYDRRYDEMVADFKASQSKMSLSYPVEILKHTASVYTLEVYRKFHEESYKAYDCHVEISGEIGELMRYKVRPNRKQWNYVVSYSETQGSVSCTCRKFEFSGILCSHILRVYSIRDVKEIPSKYVLKRWTKSAKRGSIGVINESCYVDKDPKTVMARRYKDLYRVFTRLGTRAVEIDDGYILVRDGLLNLLIELNLSSAEKQTCCNVQKNQTEKNDQIERQDMPMNVSGTMETVKGLKLKPKFRSLSSQRPKNALETTKKRTRKSKYTTTPKKNTQENHLVDSVRGASQTSSDLFHLSDPYGYSFYAPLEYGQSSMYVQPINVQPDQQVHTSYMSLLTSIGEPQRKKFVYFRRFILGNAWGIRFNLSTYFIDGVFLDVKSTASIVLNWIQNGLSVCSTCLLLLSYAGWRYRMVIFAELDDF